MKPLSNTSWECRIDGVEAIRYPAQEVFDALDIVKISEITDEPKIKAKAKSLTNQKKDYKFLVSLIFCYDVLFKVNYVSKELQGKTKDIDAKMESFEKLLSWLRIYEKEGFNGVLIGANELIETVELSLEFKKISRQKNTKKKENVFFKAQGQPFDDPKKHKEFNASTLCWIKLFNHWKLDLNNLKIM